MEELPQPIRGQNVAPRANEISGTTDANNILPEGTSRKRKRRMVAFAANEDPQDLKAEFHMTFAAALTSVLSTTAPAPGPQDERLHRDRMPPEPNNFTELMRHPFKKEFFNACGTEIEALKSRGTFRAVNRAPHHRPLPLLWVFKYKFDTDGYLVKFKARICVRGDLQISTRETNYAATLAVRVFRALMAITAAFDLDIIQLDAVNAFLNSIIDEETTIQWPPGFEPPLIEGAPPQVLQLLKALYGLKQAPLLWHNHLVEILENLGLTRVSGVNCVLTSDWLLVFFYVDDIILLFDKQYRTKAEAFIVTLQQQLELREITDANWFLGIRIVRDRPRRLLSLCQDSYIDKLTSRFNIDSKQSVLAHTPLVIDLESDYDGVATAAERQGYQSRVGSLNFAATVTRPDLSKTCSDLSKYLQNPSPAHFKAADRALSYLARTKTLAIQYGGVLDASDDPNAVPLQVYSDAAYADNKDRKSSDGYLFTLYNGPIDWKASKQHTVTTSSTEAELMAVSRTAKALIEWRRLFHGIRYVIDDKELIYVDNTQTMRLLTSDEPQLNTKLRHVDIHQHWLRERVQKEDIDIAWVPTRDMKADGFTKPLPRQRFKAFIQQLNLVDIQASISTTT